jgi:pimeloyl-ACP methyl ester carboxylesterase
VRLAAELCERQTAPAALILRSTFTSLVDVGCYHYPWLPVRLVLTERYPSAERAPAVTCPVLQLHGVNDTIVPLHLGKKLFDAFPSTAASGMAKRFVTLTDADHNDVLWVADDEMRAALSRLFAELPELK